MFSKDGPFPTSFSYILCSRQKMHVVYNFLLAGFELVFYGVRSNHSANVLTHSLPFNFVYYLPYYLAALFMGWRVLGRHLAMAFPSKNGATTTSIPKTFFNWPLVFKVLVSPACLPFQSFIYQWEHIVPQYLILLKHSMSTLPTNGGYSHFCMCIWRTLTIGGSIVAGLQFYWLGFCIFYCIQNNNIFL